MTQYGFYVDSSLCTGCKTCMISCKDDKDLGIGPKLRRVYEYGGGDWVNNDGIWEQNVFNYYLSISCNHCDNPTCVSGCPSGAMHKRSQDGLVVVDQDKCIGCRYCEMRCPYGAPQYDDSKKVMTKCDGCYEKVAQGQTPTCVESCPQRALKFGEITELRRLYGNQAEIAPLPSASLTSPNLIVKAHSNGRPTGDRSGSIQNPAEV